MIIGASGVADYIALAEQYPFSITAEAKDDKAVIRISGVIHQWNNSAEWFRNKIAEFNALGITKGTLYITTPGGSVFEAADIRNELEAFEGEIHGIGGSVVASAGGYIRLGCPTFEMVKNGQFMYHKPQGAIRGNEDTWESQLKLLKNITADYRKGYAELTGLSEDEIEARWSKGDVWMNAEQAKKEKFITGILPYKSKITATETAMFTACGAPNPPKESKPIIKTEIEMDLKFTALSVGLPETATEAEVKAKLVELKASADENALLKKAAKDKETADVQASIKSVLDKATADKKILGSQRAALEKWANADFEGFKAYLESLQPLGKISEQIKGKSGGGSASTDKKFEELSDDEKTALSEEDPEAFISKYEDYLNK